MQEDGHRSPSGNQNHGVGACNRCGWKYPNPHPSAKQRRNHKKHCGKLSYPKATGMRELDPASSPDSDQYALNLEACSTVNTDADALKNETYEDDSDELRNEKSVGAEVGEASSRFEEDFADAASEFSEAMESPRSKTVNCSQSDAEIGSGCKSLVWNQESVAVGRDVGSSEHEGGIEQKHMVISDDIEVCRLQTSSAESLKNERQGDLAASVGNPTYVDRKEGIACILATELSKTDVSGIAGVGISAEVQSGDSPDGSSTNVSTKESKKGCRKSETEVDRYHECKKIIDLNGSSMHHKHEKNTVPLHWSTELQNSLKDDNVHLEASDSQTCKDTEAISLALQTPPDEGEHGPDSESISMVTQVTDRSIYIELEPKKNGSQSKGDVDDYNYGRSKHEDAVTAKMYKNGPLGNANGTCFEVHEDIHSVSQISSFPADTEISVLAAEVNACEDASTKKEKVCLLPTATNASAEIDDYPQIVIASSNGIHNTISHHLEHLEDLVHEQEIKGREVHVTNSGSMVNIQASSNNDDAVFHDKSISLQSNACAEDKESSPLTTLTNCSCENNVSGFVSRTFAASDSSFCVAPGDAASLDAEDAVIDPCEFIELINYPNENSLQHFHSKKNPQNELQQEDLRNTPIPLSIGDEFLTTNTDSEVQADIIQAELVKEKISNGDSSICPNDDANIRVCSKPGGNSDEERSSSISKALDESASGDQLDQTPNNHSCIHEEECKALPAKADTRLIDRSICTLPTQDSRSDAHARNSGEKTVRAYEEKNDLILDLTKSAKARVNYSSTEPFLLEKDLQGDQLPLDLHIHERLQKESTLNQDYPDEIPSQIVMRASSTSYILDDEKSSVSFLTESNGTSSVLSIGGDDRPDVKKELVEVGSLNNLNVKLLVGEDKLSGTHFEPSTVGVCDKSTYQNDTTYMASDSVNVTEHETSSAGIGAPRISVHGNQKAKGNQLKETPSTDSLQMNAVVLPHQSGDDTNIPKPPSSVAPEEPSRESTDTANPSDSSLTQNALNPNSTVSDATQLPASSPVENDQQERKKIEEATVKPMGSEKAHTPLKSFLVESTERSTDLEGHNGTIQFKSMSDTKTRGSSYHVNATKIHITSPAWILSNRREKRKNRGLYSWIGCVCCSPVN